MICPRCDGEVVVISGDVARCRHCYEWYDLSAETLERDDTDTDDDDDDDDDEGDE